MDFNPQLMKELIRIYLLSDSRLDFQQRIATLTDDDDELARWATQQLFGAGVNRDD